MDRLNKRLLLAVVFVVIVIATCLLVLDLFPPDGRGLGGRIGSPD